MYNQQNVPITYVGTAPSNLVSSTDPLYLDRQWPYYNSFIDISGDCSDLNKLKLTWSEQRDNQGDVVPGASQIKKGVGGTITIEGDTYQLFKQWLIMDVSGALNSIEIKIEDVSCGTYEGYIVKSTDLQYCESGLCHFTVTLKQKDEALNCIRRTLISDNWQGWFQKVPANGKKHPRFAYCKEQRPNGTMIALWYVMGQVIGPTVLVVGLLALAINPLIAIIRAIIDVINALGGNVNKPNFIDVGAAIASFSQYFVETAGCGREQPAVLIRDYLTNVCDKCGLIVDEVTAPVLFAGTVTIQTSDPNRGNNGVITAQNPYYNLTYFFPQVKRGIRRFRSINIFGASPRNDTEFWIPDNSPLITGAELLDQIKGVFNAEWRVKSGKLYFWRKDQYLDNDYLYDFSLTGADREKILEGICYEPNEVKYPAYCTGIYQTDPSDTNEAGGARGNGQMNGIVNYGNIDDNPNFEGVQDKTQQFGATKFNLDGASGCYYYDALQQLANSGLLNLTTLFQTGAIAAALHDYGDYALLLQSEVTALPKLVIWNGDSYLNARAIMNKSAWDNTSPNPMPEINPVYNNLPETGPQSWKVRHTPDTFVVGSGLTIGPSLDGEYFVGNLFNAPIARQPAQLLNYPMYFEPFYYDTLYDWFHFIDDPRRNPVMNMNFTLKIRLCCEDIVKLGILNDADLVALNQKIKGTYPFYPDMKIREIEASYDTADTYGMYLQISGTL